VTPSRVRIAGSLVRYLRNGVKRELSTTLEILTIQLDTTLDPGTYNNALARLYDAQALFEAVGMTEDSELADLVLDLGRWARLALRLLELEYDVELTRLQNATADGVEPPLRDVPALRRLVADIRETLGAVSSKPDRPWRQIARRLGRSKGDG
jgi:hypothetical protein